MDFLMSLYFLFLKNNVISHSNKYKTPLYREKKTYCTMGT